jgi:hypothetical protein
MHVVDEAAVWGGPVDPAVWPVVIVMLEVSGELGEAFLV